ncbi:glycosyltransferase [Flavobacteriaceae bacterium]|nr:glycosyltransferase [Flavobacteriaceae bacterium]
MTTIYHIIPNLNSAGAENFLLSLSTQLSKEYNQIIYTFSNPEKDTLFPKFDSSIEFIFKKKELIGSLKNFQNPIIICWMYPSIFFLEKLRVFNKIEAKIVWNIRHASFLPLEIKQKVGLIFLGLLSNIRKYSIIYCAYASRDYHQRFLFYKRNSIVILNGLTKKLDFKDLNNEDYFLYVGRHNPSKGPDFLLRVFKKYVMINPEAKLKIAGGGWSSNQLDNALLNNIEILGNVDDLSALYAKAKCFLFTSKTEGFPNVLAEACSFGLPIITTNAGDASVILKDYPNADIATTEKHFSELLNNFNGNDFTNRDEASKDFRKRFNFDKTVSNYIKFFKSL